MLQHRLEALADGADELEHQGIDASYLDEAANTLLEANVGMREARAKAASKAKDRGFQRPPSATASASARATASASGKGKGRGKGVCWDCGLEGHRMGHPSCTKPGAALAKPKGKDRAANQAECEDDDYGDEHDANVAAAVAASGGGQ